MPKLFVASSKAAKTQAKEFIRDCPFDNLIYMPWWDHITAGPTLLDELDRISGNVDGAVIILTPEAVSTTPKGVEIVIPNLNVLFEFGYFYARFGKQKVVVVKYGTVNLPSDLGGYVHVFGSDYFRPNGKNPVSKRTHREYERWYAELLRNL